MNLRPLLTAALWLLCLSGCAAGPELRVLQASGAALELAETPFFAQSVYQCGPAALATVLVHAGVEVSPEQLEPQIYIPERRGSLQIELLAATRRHGLVPYILPGHIAPMLAELRAGHPVLVFQNLGIDSLPVWHYAVLIGFSAERETFLLRSGTDRRLEMDAQKFLASWDRAGRWSMVVVPATDPPVMAEALLWLQAVAPFESLGQLDLAAQAYEAAVKRWPESAMTWTALGNVRNRQGRLSEAESAYIHAIALASESWVARNNLVLTLLDLNCPKSARVWADQAGTPPSVMTSTWGDTLRRLDTAAAGRCAKPDVIE